MLRNNPYYYHPQPAAKLAADDVLSIISSDCNWSKLFAQGKMLGILVVEGTQSSIENCPYIHNINNVYYLTAFSGVVNGLVDEHFFFVPPIYNLQNPNDFYLQKDEEISEINRRLKDTTLQREEVLAFQQKRRELSIALQKEIFQNFNIANNKKQYKNIIEIFADAKRGLPPGGAGECSAPRLLQFAFQNNLRPVYLAEFWYGASTKTQSRVHGSFYPSCIEKCSPILKYQLGEMNTSEVPTVCSSPIRIVFEDEYLVVLSKPAGLLSVPAKDLKQDNVEDQLHRLYPLTKGPMLVHRLDQATSGLLLAAKDARTHKLLQQQFQERFVHKRYVAMLEGSLKSNCGIIDLPLVVNPDDRPRQIVDYQFGKKATTYYQIISKKGQKTRIDLYPLTGRTHQLRVHCASSFGLDSPIDGDSLYDIMDAQHYETLDNRLMLHAEEISFEHPYTKEKCQICDPAPF